MEADSHFSILSTALRDTLVVVSRLRSATRTSKSTFRGLVAHDVASSLEKPSKCRKARSFVTAARENVI